MENIHPNTVIKFNPNQLSDVRKTFGYNDVNKLNQDLDHFEEWVRKQNHFVVKNIDRNYLERFLMTNKGLIERAKKRLDILLTLRNLIPEMLKNYDIRNEFKFFFPYATFVILPTPTKDNYRVVVVKIHGGTYEGLELVTYYRYMSVLLEYMLTHDYNAGVEFILDARDMGIGILSKINPITIHKSTTMLEAYGLRLKKLHFVSGSKFFDSVLSLIRQGLSQKLRERIQVHTTIETLKDCVSKEFLPKDYGGDEGCLKEISDTIFKEVSSEKHIKWMKLAESMVTDESLRLSSKFNEDYSGMPGSFKTLCVD